MAQENKKNVVLNVGEGELRFKVGINEFSSFQNDFMPNNKVAPCENFLCKCVHSDDKERLIQLCDQGLAVDLGQAVAAEFKPDIAISVKK